MNSPGHRANILRKGLTTFGYGIVVDAKGRAAAPCRISPVPAPPTMRSATRAPTMARPLSADEQGELALEAINQERRKAGRADGASSARA